MPDTQQKLLDALEEFIGDPTNRDEHRAIASGLLGTIRAESDPPEGSGGNSPT